ncbi:MAG: NB-ARC domain-containing protein [Polyangiaceae bacterium]
MRYSLADSSSPLAHIHGREREVGAFSRLLQSQQRVITFRGPPGVGKTTIARALSRSLAREGNPVVFVSLSQAASVFATIARTLGIAARTSNEEVLLERIVRELEVRPRTLFLDIETEALAATRSLLHLLVPETTETTFVVACRTVLGIPDEAVVVLSPLKIGESVSLLQKRAHQLAPERALPSEVAEQLASLTGGLPLAIEIAAGWVAAIGAAEALKALREGSLAMDALDQALEASWALLHERERITLASLTVFEGSFDLEIAGAVADTPDVAAHLAVLASASLLEVEDTESGALYSLLAGIRAFAGKRWGGPLDDARERLSAYLAQSVRPRADLPGSWVRLARERDDILAAWRRAIAHDPARALRLAVVVEPSLAAHGPSGIHRAIVEQSIAESEKAHLPSEETQHARATIDLLYALGRLEAFRNQYTASISPFERGLKLSQEIHDDIRTGWLCAHLAISLSVLGQKERARALMTTARTLADGAQDDRLKSTAHRACAEYAASEGDFVSAEESYRRAIAAAHSAKALRLEGIALLGCAVLQRKWGRLSEASSYLADAEARFRLVSDPVFSARALVQRGHLLLASDKVHAAEEAYLGAHDAAELHDDVECELESTMGLVRAAVRKDPHLAARRIDMMDLLLRRSDDPAWAERVAELRAESMKVQQPETIPLALRRDGRSFELFSRTIDFTRRGPLRRILVALARSHDEDPARALSVAEVLAAGWPDEKMLHDSGNARVYMAVRRLRAQGLEAVLRTSDAGYRLDERVRVTWS